MKLRENWRDLSFKERVDVVGDIVTIIVSVMAIWGSIAAWKSGFFHKADHLISYYHNKMIQEEQKLSGDL